MTRSAVAEELNEQRVLEYLRKHPDLLKNTRTCWRC